MGNGVSLKMKRVWWRKLTLILAKRVELRAKEQSVYLCIGEPKATSILYLITKSIPFHFTNKCIHNLHIHISSSNLRSIRSNLSSDYSSASFHYSQSQSFSSSLAVLSDTDRIQRCSTSHFGPTATSLSALEKNFDTMFSCINSLSKPEEEEAQKKNYLKHLFSFHRL